jgi:hypothetical protein
MIAHPYRTIALAALALGAVVALPAAAQDAPKLRAGQWEVVRKSDRAGDKPMRTTLCIDDAMQRDMWTMGMGAMRGMCSKSDIRFAAGRGNVDLVCNLGATTMRSKATITFTGDTAYRTDIDTTYDPPSNGTTRTRSVVESRWLGACKAGQQPGDMVLPNGTTINMRNALGGGAQPSRPSTDPKR